MQREPEVGDKFWDSELFSGKIEGIDWASRTVYVTFWEKGSRTYEFDDLLGCWTEAYGGTWQYINF